MKGDKKILTKMMDLREQVNTYIESVEMLGNACAWTDRMLETALDTASEIKAIHDKQFSKNEEEEE